jgi:hypothetical protein
MTTTRKETEMIDTHPPFIDTKRFDRRLFGFLLVGATVGAIAVIPYQLGIAPDAPEQAGLSVSAFAAVTFLSGLLLAAAGAAVGLLLGPRVGLGAPLLTALSEGRADRKEAALVLRPAVGIGLVLAGLVVALDLAMSAHLPPVASGEIGLMTRYAASIYGAINEELLLRMGLLTAVVWGATRIRGTSAPSRKLLWAATGMSALAFGILHLPAVATIAELTPVVVGRTIGFNVLLGTAFGWLYWSRGLLAAMAAHLAADIVIQSAAWLIA